MNKHEKYYCVNKIANTNYELIFSSILLRQLFLPPSIYSGISPVYAEPGSQKNNRACPGTSPHPFNLQRGGFVGLPRSRSLAISLLMSRSCCLGLKLRTRFLSLPYSQGQLHLRQLINWHRGACHIQALESWFGHRRASPLQREHRTSHVKEQDQPIFQCDFLPSGFKFSSIGEINGTLPPGLPLRDYLPD